MSSRNGSYARIVDAQGVQNSKTDKAPVQTPKSPETSKDAFGGKTQVPAREIANQNNPESRPKANRALQPRGFGERGVNWQAHNAKRSQLRDSIDSPSQKMRKAKAKEKLKTNPKMAVKVKKAVCNAQTISKDFSKGKGLGH